MKIKKNKKRDLPGNFDLLGLMFFCDNAFSVLFMVFKSFLWVMVVNVRKERKKKRKMRMKVLDDEL